MEERINELMDRADDLERELAKLRSIQAENGLNAEGRELYTTRFMQLRDTQAEIAEIEHDKAIAELMAWHPDQEAAVDDGVKIGTKR